MPELITRKPLAIIGAGISGLIAPPTYSKPQKPRPHRYQYVSCLRKFLANLVNHRRTSNHFPNKLTPLPPTTPSPHLCIEYPGYTN